MPTGLWSTGSDEACFDWLAQKSLSLSWFRNNVSSPRADADPFIKKKGRVLASLLCAGSWQHLFLAGGRAPPRSDIETDRQHSQLGRSMEERRPTDTTSTAPSSAPAPETSTAHIIHAECSGRALSHSCARRGQRRRVSPPGNWWAPRRRGHLGWSSREQQCSDGC